MFGAAAFGPYCFCKIRGGGGWGRVMEQAPRALPPDPLPAIISTIQ